MLALTTSSEAAQWVGNSDQGHIAIFVTGETSDLVQTAEPWQDTSATPWQLGGDREEQTVLLDLRERPSHPFEAAMRKAELMLRATHFVHPSRFPSCARLTLCLPLLSSECQQSHILRSRDQVFPTTGGGEQGYVSRYRSQESAPKPKGTTVTVTSQSLSPFTPMGFVKVGEHHTRSNNACSCMET